MFRSIRMEIEMLGKTKMGKDSAVKNVKRDVRARKRHEQREAISIISALMMHLTYIAPFAQRELKAHCLSALSTLWLWCNRWNHFPITKEIAACRASFGRTKNKKKNVILPIRNTRARKKENSAATLHASVIKRNAAREYKK